VLQTAQVYGACLGKNIQILIKDFKLSTSKSDYDYQNDLGIKYSKIYEDVMSGRKPLYLVEMSWRGITYFLQLN
jgi:hypothetical protein